MAEQFDCPVCFGVIDNKHNEIRMLVCGHLYHTDCIQLWEIKNSYCIKCCRDINYTDYVSISFDDIRCKLYTADEYESLCQTNNTEHIDNTYNTTNVVEDSNKECIINIDIIDDSKSVVDCSECIGNDSNSVVDCSECIGNDSTSIGNDSTSIVNDSTSIVNDSNNVVECSKINISNNTITEQKSTKINASMSMIVNKLTWFFGVIFNFVLNVVILNIITGCCNTYRTICSIITQYIYNPVKYGIGKVQDFLYYIFSKPYIYLILHP